METVELKNKSWIKIGIRRDASSSIPNKTEMFLIEHSANYHGRVEGRGFGSHYDLGFLSLDANDGYTIIING